MSNSDRKSGVVSRTPFVSLLAKKAGRKALLLQFKMEENSAGAGPFGKNSSFLHR